MPAKQGQKYSIVSTVDKFRVYEYLRDNVESHRASKPTINVVTQRIRDALNLPTLSRDMVRRLAIETDVYWDPPKGSPFTQESKLREDLSYVAQVLANRLAAKGEEIPDRLVEIALRDEAKDPS